MVSACEWQMRWKIFIIGSFWAANLVYTWSWTELAGTAGMRWLYWPPKVGGGPTHPFLAGHNGSFEFSSVVVAVQKVKTFHTLTLHLELGSSRARPARLGAHDGLKICSKKPRSSILCFVRSCFQTEYLICTAAVLQLETKKLVQSLSLRSGCHHRQFGALFMAILRRNGGSTAANELFRGINYPLC